MLVINIKGVLMKGELFKRDGKSYGEVSYIEYRRSKYSGDSFLVLNREQWHWMSKESDFMFRLEDGRELWVLMPSSSSGLKVGFHVTAIIESGDEVRLEGYTEVQ